MTQETTNISESESLAQAYEALLEVEPKLIERTVPRNADEEKKRFLAGETRNPAHIYDRLEQDFENAEDSINERMSAITLHPDFNPRHVSIYADVASNYRERLALMKAAYLYNNAEDDGSKAMAASRYMEVNIELYGAPDVTVYRELLRSRMSAINQKELTGYAAQLRDELNELVGPQPEESAEVFTRPSTETIAWAHEAVELLYGGMLKHIPEQESFTKPEIKAVFEEIIRDEFGEAAEGWQVIIRSAKSINVVAGEKKIILPDNEVNLKRTQVRRLVVHELGIHMLRAVSGEATDVLPLRTGIANYYDAEEGLGVVMEQAIEGKYEERGVPYYLIAGAAYHEQRDFRDLYERQWRLSALSTLKTTDISPEEAAKKQSFAYSSVMRIMRGTDDIPWFKDLAYFNGANDVWRYLEQYQGDDLMLSLLLTSGKLNPDDPDHRRIALELATP